MNGNVTPSEELLMALGKGHILLVNEASKTKEGSAFVGSHFLNRTDDAYIIAHVHTLNEIGGEFDDLTDLAGVDITNDDIVDAYTWLMSPRLDVLDDKGKPTGKKISLINKFYDLYKDLKDLVYVSSDTNELFSAFVNDHINSFQSMSEGAQIVSTSLFLLGGNTDKVKVVRFLPKKLMHEKLHGPYLARYQDKLNNLTSEMRVMNKGQIKKLPGVKELRTVRQESLQAWKDADKPLEMQIRCK